MQIQQKRKLNSLAKEYKIEGNNICYEKFHNALFGDKKDTANNTGFRYINGTMKTYEQSKRDLSYVYHKRIVLQDGISTIPLNI